MSGFIVKEDHNRAQRLIIIIIIDAAHWEKANYLL